VGASMGVVKRLIPQIGVRESRDVTLYEGTASVLPDDGSAAAVQDVHLPKLTQPRRRPTAHLRRSTQRVSGITTMRGRRGRRRGNLHFVYSPWRT